MTSFVGMIVFLVALLAALVGLSYLFYLAAGGLALLFAGLGVPAEWGAAVANLVTMMLVVLMIPGSLLSVAERKWSALIQNRVGCNRIRVFGSSLGGIPVLVADALKMLTKERFTPDRRTKFLFDLAPVLAFAPIFALFGIVPVGQTVALGLPYRFASGREVFAQLGGRLGGALGDFSWDSLPSAGKRFGIQPLAAGTVDGRLAGNRDRVPSETGEDYRRVIARTS